MHQGIKDVIFGTCILVGLGIILTAAISGGIYAALGSDVFRPTLPCHTTKM